jgi:hypothetical protein
MVNVKTIIEPEKKIPVGFKADVVVVGGGPAGIGAALAAARNGVKTILIEQLGYLGGAATNCLVTVFEGVDFDIYGGIFEEICKELKREGKVLTDTWACFTFDGEYYKYLLNNMAEGTGIELLFHAHGVGAIKDGNMIKGVFIESKEGRQAVLGKIIIDTTGSADIAWKSGTPCMTEGHPSGRPLGFTWAVMYGGVDTDKLIKLKQEHPDEWGPPIIAEQIELGGRPIIPRGYLWGGHGLVKQGKVEGELYQNHENFNLIVMPGQGRVLVQALHVGLPRGHHGWRVEDLTYGEIDARKQSWSTYNYLKKNLPGFKNAFIEQTPTHLGMRDTHRILGEYVLTKEDMLQGRAFDDSIAICNFPEDIHGPDEGHSGRRDILPYDIPYRCLVPKDTENLLAAGSITSTDISVWASSRNMACSMSTGQAAGTAAALAVKNEVTPRKLDMKLLQHTLHKQGAEISVRYVPKRTLDVYRRHVEMIRAWEAESSNVDISTTTYTRKSTG